MALIKRKTRKKLSKQLSKLVKRHGPEMALALVGGIVSKLTTDESEASAKPEKTAKKARPAPRSGVPRKRAGAAGGAAER